jgi:hypothetical protein
MSRWFSIPTLLALGLAAVPCCRAQAADESAAPANKQWPLRLHILAIDDTHRTVRMQPNWSSGSMPDFSGGDVSMPQSDNSLALGGGDDDFSGAGRADLVTPPDGNTVGLNFTYEGCPRVRVPPGFQGLEARWKKQGSKLEVMIPTDAVTDGPSRVQRCTIKLVTQPFVYLRMRNGAILRVSQEAYLKKPSLRVFLSGGTEALQRRTPKLAESSNHPQG